MTDGVTAAASPEKPGTLVLADVPEKRTAEDFKVSRLATLVESFTFQDVRKATKPADDARRMIVDSGGGLRLTVTSIGNVSDGWVQVATAPNAYTFTFSVPSTAAATATGNIQVHPFGADVTTADYDLMGRVTVASDQRGLAQSVVGRLERHGGSAEVRSAPGSGTEVALRMPRDGARPK